jgi:hypothetical protein
MTKYVIEDERHAERQGEFATSEGALLELRRRASLPWDDQPNRAPCTNWASCGRDYEILEYTDTSWPKPSRRTLALRISSKGGVWQPPFTSDSTQHVTLRKAD